MTDINLKDTKSERKKKTSSNCKAPSVSIVEFLKTSVPYKLNDTCLKTPPPTNSTSVLLGDHTDPVTLRLADLKCASSFNPPKTVTFPSNSNRSKPIKFMGAVV